MAGGTPPPPAMHQGARGPPPSPGRPGGAVGGGGTPPPLARIHGVVGGPRPPAEPRRAVVHHCLLDPGVVVHHKRSVLHDGLVNGPALEQQSLGTIRTADNL